MAWLTLAVTLILPFVIIYRIAAWQMDKPDSRIEKDRRRRRGADWRAHRGYW